MKREVLEKRERQLDNLDQSLIEFERLQRIFKTQTIAIYMAIVLLFVSIAVNAQEVNHEIDTIKYSYFDMKERPVRNSFFAEKNMGWRMWLLADDGTRRKKVWVDTIKE